jgi:tetraacyldisaccharide-1-P 4'-kinase
LTATEIFPDHHFYTPNDIAKLEKKARETGARVLITTVKDAVKLNDLEMNFPVFSAENRIIFEDEQDFINLLLS